MKLLTHARMAGLCKTASAIVLGHESTLSTNGMFLVFLLIVGDREGKRYILIAQLTVSGAAIIGTGGCTTRI